MVKFLRTSNSALLIGGLVASLVLLCGVFAPWLAPYHPNDPDLLYLLAPPGSAAAPT